MIACLTSTILDSLCFGREYGWSSNMKAQSLRDSAINTYMASKSMEINRNH